MTTIAGWSAEGVLPPFAAAAPTGPDRSPYRATLEDCVTRFGISTERRTILDGLLRYRAALHAAGLVSGFQWLDGSFVEDIEQLEGRAPKDVDVVTFYRRPGGKTQLDLMTATPDLFERTTVKSMYSVDAFPLDLGMEAERLVRRSAYWYSVWAHRRNGVWKGFVEVDLDPSEDAAAAAALGALPKVGP